MIISKTRKWGSSLGVVIPKQVVKEFKLRENEEIAFEITKKENPLKELFGSGKFSKPTEQLLKEVRGKESKYF